MEDTTSTGNAKMKWYHYIMIFFSAVFIANTIPHLVNGISGNPFPSPFSNPPGKGLSSPMTNVIWALINLIIGYLLFRFSRINTKNKLALLTFFLGFAIMSIWLSLTFVDKLK